MTTSSCVRCGMACVQICDSAERGQVLICTQDVPAGHLLLAEEPIFLSPSSTILDQWDALEQLDF